MVKNGICAYGCSEEIVVSVTGDAEELEPS